MNSPCSMFTASRLPIQNCKYPKGNYSHKRLDTKPNKTKMQKAKNLKPKILPCKKFDLSLIAGDLVKLFRIPVVDMKSAQFLCNSPSRY